MILCGFSLGWWTVCLTASPGSECRPQCSSCSRNHPWWREMTDWALLPHPPRQHLTLHPTPPSCLDTTICHHTSFKDLKGLSTPHGFKSRFGKYSNTYFVSHTECISQGPPETQNQQETFIVRNWLVCWWRLESLKIHIWQAVDPGELVVWAPVWTPAGLRPKKRRCFSLSPKAGKDGCLSSRQSGRRRFALLRRFSLFALARPSTDWMRPTHSGEGNLLYSVYRCKC